MFSFYIMKLQWLLKSVYKKFNNAKRFLQTDEDKTFILFQRITNSFNLFWINLHLIRLPLLTNLSENGLFSLKVIPDEKQTDTSKSIKQRQDRNIYFIWKISSIITYYRYIIRGPTRKYQISARNLESVRLKKHDILLF